MHLDAKSLFLVFSFVFIYAEGSQRGLLTPNNPSLSCPGPALSLVLFCFFSLPAYFSLEWLLSVFLSIYIL